LAVFVVRACGYSPNSIDAFGIMYIETKKDMLSNRIFFL